MGTAQPERRHTGATEASPEAEGLERATATLQALLEPRWHSRRHDLFGRRRALLWRSFAHLWPFANLWSAVATLASAPGGAAAARQLGRFVGGLAHYGAGGAKALGGTGPIGFDSSVVAPLGTGGERYFDDNAWLGLALVRQHQLTGDPQALSLARRVRAFVVSGWSTNDEWAWPGGIRWKEPRANRSRNTCSNAPAAQLCVLVHELGGDHDDLTWAARIYEWVRRALWSDDLYLDHVMPDGAIDGRIFSYNQGTMIGAGVLLAGATGDPAYLAQASSTAEAAMARFGLSRLMGQELAFNAVYLRNLLLWADVVEDARPRPMAAEYAEAIWATARDGRTGLFSRGRSFLNDTAAMIEICALVGGAAPHA